MKVLNGNVYYKQTVARQTCDNLKYFITNSYRE